MADAFAAMTAVAEIVMLAVLQMIAVALVTWMADCSAATCTNCTMVAALVAEIP